MAGEREQHEERETSKSLPRLVLLEETTPTKLAENIQLLEKARKGEELETLIRNLTKNSERNYPYRGYSVVTETPNNYNQIKHYSIGSDQQRPIWFAFSGAGSQWPGMGKSLMQLPVFAKVIRKCHETLRGRGVDLLAAVTNDDPTVFDNSVNIFVGIAAFQAAIVDVLRSVGVEPQGMLGLSLGELACGYADGCLSIEEIVLSAYAIGKASADAQLIKVKMATVGMDHQSIQDQLPHNIEMVCHNSASKCTVLGPAEDLETFVEKLHKEGVQYRILNTVDIPFHCKYMQTAGELLVKYLREFTPEPKKRTSKWVSTSYPESQWGTELAQYCSAEYLANNMLNTVFFEEGMTHIPPNAVVIEISPHCQLQTVINETVPTATCIPLTKGFSDLSFFLDALGKIFLADIEVKIDELYSN